MKDFDITKLVRANVLSLAPYSCARNEFSGEASVWVDANESPFNAPYNRYPDPLQVEVKARLADIKGVPAENIFLGNGSDECIDLIYRVFCEPARDNVLAIAPSYGMYEVCANINNVAFKKVPLNDDFSLNVDALLNAVTPCTKAIWICSPNNPTGNAFPVTDIQRVLEAFSGIVVVDEAYADFSTQPSMRHSLSTYPNLVVMQTFSKAWGSAGVRLGMAFASVEIINLFNKVKYPYNVNILTQRYALAHMAQISTVEQQISTILAERKRLIERLATLPQVEQIYPTDANFVLVKVTDANAIYQHLQTKGIVVRNRNKVEKCGGCLRITVGTAEENDAVIAGIKMFGNPTAEEICLPTSGDRSAKIVRNTAETQISVLLNLDGKGECHINTGIGFFDHMLHQIGKHSGIDLNINVVGDLHVDEHHTIEDTGIALGEAIYKALGSKRGIERYGFALPMDDCFCTVALDFGGRSWLVWDAQFNREMIGDCPTEMLQHFFKSLSDSAKMNLYISAQGTNEHHKAEAIFKALARALRAAVRRDVFNYQLPSTKGAL